MFELKTATKERPMTNLDGFDYMGEVDPEAKKLLSDKQAERFNEGLIRRAWDALYIRYGYYSAAFDAAKEPAKNSYFKERPKADVHEHLFHIPFYGTAGKRFLRCDCGVETIYKPK